MKRPGHGNAGRSLAIHVNAFVVSIPDHNVYHYDGLCHFSYSLHDSSKVVPSIVGMLQLTIPYTVLCSIWLDPPVILPTIPASETQQRFKIIEQLQTDLAKDVPQRPAVYDGEKNLFSSDELALGPSKAAEVSTDFVGVFPLYFELRFDLLVRCDAS